MRALPRSPLLHFLLLGLLLAAARGWLGETRSRGRERVVLETERVVALAEGFEQRNGRRPERHELEPLVRAALDDEILYHEALARGLAEDDPAIEARLVEKMLFLDASARVADAPALLERARALELERDDPIVRSLLIEKLLRIATALPSEDEPDLPSLERAYQTQRERWRAPARFDLVHVFVSRDRRGARTEDHARRLSEGLSKRRASPLAEPPVESALSDEAAARLGDPFPLGHVLAGRDEAELDRLFGPGFGAAVAALPLGHWSEPIASAYGLHLVRVEAREAGAVPAFDAVRERLRLELEAERRGTRRAALLATLRTRYELAVEWPGEERR